MMCISPELEVVVPSTLSVVIMFHSVISLLSVQEVVVGCLLTFSVKCLRCWVTGHGRVSTKGDLLRMLIVR